MTRHAPVWMDYADKRKNLWCPRACDPRRHSFPAATDAARGSQYAARFSVAESGDLDGTHSGAQGKAIQPLRPIRILSRAMTHLACCRWVGGSGDGCRRRPPVPTQSQCFGGSSSAGGPESS